MTEETTQTTQSEHKISIGARLKSAREALGINAQDVADHLRLKEEVITMIEKDHYPNDLPDIFIRGYIRSYGKYVQLPDYEIKEALAPVQPPVQETPEETSPEPAPMRIASPTFSAPPKKLVMRTATFAIALTMVGLVWMWWQNHNSNLSTKPGNISIAIPSTSSVKSASKSASKPVQPTPIQTGIAFTEQTIKIPLAPQVKNAVSKTSVTPVAAKPKSAPVAEPQKVVTAQTNAHSQAAITESDDDYYEDE